MSPTVLWLELRLYILKGLGIVKLNFREMEQPTNEGIMWVYVLLCGLAISLGGVLILEVIGWFFKEKPEDDFRIDS